MPGFLICILAGLLIGFVGLIWGAVLAFRTAVWWGLIYILVPLGWPIFLIAHLGRTLKPTLIILLGALMVVAGVKQAPQRVQASVARQKLPAADSVTAPTRPQTQVADQRAQLQEYKAQAERRYVELTQKRATTKPDDDAAILAFNQEVIQYNALLEQIKTLEAQGQPTN
jgi:hypothetical protein